MTFRLFLLLALLGCHRGPAPCIPQVLPPISLPAEDLGQVAATVQPAPPLEALELEVSPGVAVQVTASGDVTETRGNQSKAIPLPRRRREALQRLFRERPEDGPPVGWLSYVPPDLREVVVRMRHEGGDWSSVPTYRRCTPSATHCRWVTERTNAFVDQVAKLAGYGVWVGCGR